MRTTTTEHEAHARLHDAARRRAEELRREAIQCAIDACLARARQLLRAPAVQATVRRAA